MIYRKYVFFTHDIEQLYVKSYNHRFPKLTINTDLCQLLRKHRLREKVGISPGGRIIGCFVLVADSISGSYSEMQFYLVCRGLRQPRSDQI